MLLNSPSGFNNLGVDFLNSLSEFHVETDHNNSNNYSFIFSVIVSISLISFSNLIVILVYDSIIPFISKHYFNMMLVSNIHYAIVL